MICLIYNVTLGEHQHTSAISSNLLPPCRHTILFRGRQLQTVCSSDAPVFNRS